MERLDGRKISYPNLVNICIDEKQNGEIAGRIYQSYTEDPWRFSNIVDLLQLLEHFYDDLLFPQSFTENRHFHKTQQKQHPRMEKVRETSEILTFRGRKETFVTCVKYRQNATWQGETYWMEKGENYLFDSSLEFIKILNNALG